MNPIPKTDKPGTEGADEAPIEDRAAETPEGTAADGAEEGAREKGEGAGTTAEPGAETVTAAVGGVQAAEAENSDDDDDDDGDGDDDDGGAEVLASGDGSDDAYLQAMAPSGVGVGAASIIGAGIGLASVTGTWLGDLMSSRKELSGQIDSQGKEAAEAISMQYGEPWHTVALFNGFFAAAAILITGVVLLRPAFGEIRVVPAVWIRAVALAGLVLGVIGLLISGALYFDIFTELPTVPEQPAQQQAPSGQ